MVYGKLMIVESCIDVFIPASESDININDTNHNINNYHYLIYHNDNNDNIIIIIMILLQRKEKIRRGWLRIRMKIRIGNIG